MIPSWAEMSTYVSVNMWPMITGASALFFIYTVLKFIGYVLTAPDEPKQVRALGRKPEDEFKFVLSQTDIDKGTAILSLTDEEDNVVPQGLFQVRVALTNPIEVFDTMRKMAQVALIMYPAAEEEEAPPAENGSPASRGIAARHAVPTS